jgi:hypothetical protein
MTTWEREPEDDFDEWVLWLDLWARAPRDPDVARDREALDRRWRAAITETHSCSSAWPMDQPVRSGAARSEIPRSSRVRRDESLSGENNVTSGGDSEIGSVTLLLHPPRRRHPRLGYTSKCKDRTFVLVPPLIAAQPTSLLNLTGTEQSLASTERRAHGVCRSRPPAANGTQLC